MTIRTNAKYPQAQIPRGIVEAQQILRNVAAHHRPHAMAGASQGGERRGANVVLAEVSDNLEALIQASAQRFQKTDETVADLQASFQSAIDGLASRIAAGSTGAVVAGDRADDPAYTKIFSSFVRGGDNEHELRVANKEGHLAQINASMSVGSNTDGGYLAPTEWDRKIIGAQLAQSPLRRLSSVVITGVNAYSTLWDSQGWGSGWVGETASRPNTSNTTLAPLTFTTGEIYANPAVTQRLLDDAAINLETWLQEEVSKEFTRQENVAFISGNGVNKPSGLLTYAVGGTNAATHPGGALDTITAAGATAVTMDELIDFSYGLGSAYRQNASWLVSSTSVAKLTKLKDGDGNYLWRESVVVGQPPTLLGRPVEVDENMPAMTTGNLAIAYGDFKAGYLINDRIGVRVLRDPYTNKPFVNFYCTKRVGGGVRDPRAIRLIKMA